MRRASIALAALFATALCAAAAAPRVPLAVVSVDPPNWWTAHSWNPVQVLVRGSGLSGARLTTSAPGVSIERQRVNGAGTYLIAYLRITPDARPGRVDLRVEGPGGAAATALDLLAPAPREKRYQGVGPSDVVYLVMPDRFANGDTSNDGPPGAPTPARAVPRAYHGGDLAGIAARLPYLADLGVTTIWFTPIYDNDDASQDYHGYHATDFYDVEERFGTLRELQSLVDAAHRAGLKVMQDQVANHTGPRHPWVASPPTPTWYHGTPASHLDNAFDITSIVSENGDPALRRATLEGWFANILPDLNQEDPDAAHYLVQNSLWWIGTTGIDAIRQDTLPYAPREYWAAWTRAIEAEYPRFTVLGEVFNGDPKVVSFFQGGVARRGVDTGVDQLFDFPLDFAVVHYLARRKGADEVARIVSEDAYYPNALGLVPFAGNHDTPRAISLLNGDARALRLAHTIVMTMRGTPQIYYGDEIGMPGGEDPDNRRDFPGGFPNDPRDAFTAAGRTDAQQRTFENLCRLLALRKAHPALRGAKTTFLVAEGPLLVYAREGEGERAIVAVNASDVELAVDAAAAGFADGTSLADALADASPQREIRVRGGRLAFRLAPASAVVLFPR